MKTKKQGRVGNVITKGINFPPSKYGLELLEVGESTEYPLDLYGRVHGTRSRVTKETGRSFSFRREGETFRVWRRK